MKFITKNSEKKNIKRSFKSALVLYSIFFVFFSMPSYAQDSIALPKDLNEEKELKFQQYFFKALAEKSIRNFQKAIENLESCNQIIPNDVAVFFEFSKNYFALYQIELAKEYIDRALVKDPENFWMLQHLVAVLQRSNSYAEAIEIQIELVAKKPKNVQLKEGLTKLYLRDNQPEKALETINLITEQNGSTVYLRNLKTALEKRKLRFTKEEEPTKLVSFQAKFDFDKTYLSLERLLKNSKNEVVLLKYSKQGIQRFPAQPYVYLVQGKILNQQKGYKNALSILKSGIDFVIEDEMEQDFYKEIAKSYKGLGNLKEEKKYLKKLNKD
ncbi:tetratricopeptide repeat protein [Polaribacter sp.]|nr:tetratricopeptide repeat protein [Polaribacter sp.]